MLHNIVLPPELEAHLTAINAERSRRYQQLALQALARIPAACPVCGTRTSLADVSHIYENVMLSDMYNEHHLEIVIIRTLQYAMSGIAREGDVFMVFCREHTLADYMQKAGLSGRVHSADLSGSRHPLRRRRLTGVWPRHTGE